MQVKRFVGSMIAVASGLLWTVAAGAAAQHQHTAPAGSPAAAQAAAPEKAEQQLKVGKNGDVTVSVESLVGEMRLKPGRYVLQHRVDGSDHFVHFTGASIDHPGEVKCKLEALDKKVARTEVYTTKEGEARRVTKVLIRGENVAHIF